METVEVLAPNEKRCSRCKEVKDRGEFGKDNSNKDGLKYVCKLCANELCKERFRKIRNKDDNASLECPVCGKRYSNLLTHALPEHGLTKNDLYHKYGFENILSTRASKNLSSILRNSPNKTKLGNEAVIGNNYISFPKKIINKDCKYLRVKIVEDKLQIHFNPAPPDLIDAKLITSQRGRRGQINIPEQFSSHLKIFRPTFELRDSAGFYIQLFDEDKELFYLFDIWACHPKSLRNSNPLSTLIYKKKKFINESHTWVGKQCYFSLAENIWPVNAAYAYFEYIKPTRKNGHNYLDIFPVSKSGFIVGKNLNSKQYIGIEECKKVLRRQGVDVRLSVLNTKFIHENNIPSGDWDLKEVLPSGALRFRLYKERQSKQEQLEFDEAS